VSFLIVIFFFQAEDGIRYRNVTGVQTCALPISQVERIQHIQNQAVGSDDEKISNPHFKIIANHISKYSSPKTLEEVGKELNVTRSEERRVGKERRDKW